MIFFYKEMLYGTLQVADANGTKSITTVFFLCTDTMDCGIVGYGRRESVH